MRELTDSTHLHLHDDFKGWCRSRIQQDAAKLSAGQDVFAHYLHLPHPCVPLQQQWLHGPVQVTASSWDSAPACCRANSPAPVLCVREGCSPGTWSSQMKSVLEVLHNYC